MYNIYEKKERKKEMEMKRGEVETDELSKLVS
jgi:hypothetical protein